MKCGRSFCFRVTLLVTGWLANAVAGTISIVPTPIIKASLPGSTYQVEYSTNGTTWISTGVLVAGGGTTNTVRLDGFPDNASYRFSAVGAVGTVTATTSRGLHLRSSSFAGADELRIEACTQLAGTPWTNQAFVFTNLQGVFISPIRSSLASNSFFRAVQPASPLPVATVTSYIPDINNTYAGYGIVADDMPQLYRDGRIAAVCPAVYHRGGSNAASAGECYELVGPQGKSTVMVAEIANDSPSGTCDVGRPYFDTGTAAFTNLFTPDIGLGPVTYRLVPAPVVGDLKMVCVNNSGGFYVELRPYNHRAGVSKLEVQPASGSWIELSRTAYNSFVYNSAVPIALPFNCRVTSRFGEVISFLPIDVLTNGSRITATGQFTSFPDQEPSPIWICPPVYSEGFTNNVGAYWTPLPSSGVAINPTYSGSAYQGSYSLRITNWAGFSLVQFLAPLTFPKQTDGFLEFAIRSEGVSITRLVAQIRGLDAAGGVSSSSLVNLPTIDNTWRVLRIPLDSVGAPPQIQSFYLQNNSSATAPPIDIDSITFRW